MIDPVFIAAREFSLPAAFTVQAGLPVGGTVRLFGARRLGSTITVTRG